MIQGSLYLIGSNRCNCELRGDICMIRVGGGYERFEDYVPKNHRLFERTLVTYMLNSDKSLDWVVNQLIKGNKIKSDVMISRKGKDFSSVLDSDTE